MLFKIIYCEQILTIVQRLFVTLFAKRFSFMETGTDQTSMNNSFQQTCSTNADAEVFLSVVQVAVYLGI